MGIWKKLFGAKPSHKAPDEHLPNAASAWFKDPSRRHGPHSPTDFNLQRIVRCGVNEWSKRVSAEPQKVRCTEVQISSLGQATTTLFETIKNKHGLDSNQAVKLFDEYLAGACPKCFHGITGGGLQMVAAGSQMAAVVGGGDSFARLLSGHCANCESEVLFVVWHGDKSFPVEEAPQSAPQATSSTSSIPAASWRPKTQSVVGMDQERRKTIYREHKELTHSCILKYAMMGLPQQTAIERALEDAANQVERTYGITFEQFMSIYKEGNAKKCRLPSEWGKRFIHSAAPSHCRRIILPRIRLGRAAQQSGGPWQSLDKMSHFVERYPGPATSHKG